MPIVCVSGGFDPITNGHTRLIQDAARTGDVVVILNSDAWLMRKKGYVFMPWSQRAEILEAIVGVVGVVPVDDIDGTVCAALKIFKPHYFANGGDRFADNVPEAELCNRLGIKMLFNVGGEKIASSSELVRAVK